MNARTVSARLPWAAPLVLSSLLGNACFTEVGNPDDEEMSAVLRVALAHEDSAGLLAPDSVGVSRLVLRLHRVDEYSGATRTGSLWSDGRSVAFAPGDSLPRARMSAPRGADSVVLRLGTVAGGAFPDTPNSLASLDWDAFAGEGYVKGVYHRGGRARRFLFALPGETAYAPTYGKAALDSWRDASGYHCLFLFRPRQWMAQAGLDSAKAFVVAAGDSVVIFDGTRNAALHAALLQRFSGAFNGEHPAYYPAHSGR